MSGSDAQSRRNILQGLQQTRSRLQKQHSEDPQRHSRSMPTSSHAHKPSPTFSPHQLTAPPRPAHMVSHIPPHTPYQPHMMSPSPTNTTADHSAVLAQQQKMAMQQASSQSFGYYIPQPSTHSNLILPVLPRFDSSGQLT